MSHLTGQFPDVLILNMLSITPDYSFLFDLALYLNGIFLQKPSLTILTKIARPITPVLYPSLVFFLTLVFCHYINHSHPSLLLLLFFHFLFLSNPCFLLLSFFLSLSLPLFLPISLLLSSSRTGTCTFCLLTHTLGVKIDTDT